MQKGRLWLHTTQLTPMEPAAAMAWKAEQTTRRAREFKGPVATPSAQSGPDARSQSLTDENLMPLTSRQLAAFQDIFKLFGSSPTGAVDMHSMKVALRSAGIQLSPREMCEALQQADLDGDGIVSFKDFLGVLTDNHRLAQCMGQVRNSCISDPQGLQTLFFEMLFKLLRQGFVPSKSVQELKSYYSKKQQALRLDPGWRGRSRGHGCPTHAHVGLTFFCQAARVGGLSSSELARSLHRLYKAGPALRTTCSSASSRVPAPLARSPYAQIPNLEARRPPEHRTWSRASGPSVRLPKPYRPGRPKLPPNSGRLSQGSVRPWKLAPSPATLVQKQPFSPSPTCLQRPAVKSVN
ncbi:EF-hand calcium-binding domain-containing protein 3-like [Lemur catta]|uniref:EF-hand calcium-binding domain-containing protein 3-like n=1 Tax=Lemur catta TaxID=9447 RepID=UPI001E266F20|nr:EF-hand calcium-binding domain-containing protein 3-like [Lemur catta]